MPDFDQELYRRLIDEEPDPPAIHDVEHLLCHSHHIDGGPAEVRPSPLSSWRDGYKAGIRLAARISAQQRKEADRD